VQGYSDAGEPTRDAWVSIEKGDLTAEVRVPPRQAGALITALVVIAATFAAVLGPALTLRALPVGAPTWLVASAVLAWPAVCALAIWLVCRRPRRPRRGPTDSDA
jgi:cyanate permease